MKTLSVAVVCVALILPTLAYGSPYRLQYGGRITLASGQPVEGPVSIAVNFYSVGSGGTILATQSFSSVSLTDGVFNLNIELSVADFHTVFASTEAWIEIIDSTSGKIYPRQRFSAVPYAFKVPVDSTTIGYNSDGQLSVKGLAGTGLPAGTPAEG